MPGELSHSHCVATPFASRTSAQASGYCVFMMNLWTVYIRQSSGLWLLSLFIFPLCFGFWKYVVEFVSFPCMAFGFWELHGKGSSVWSCRGIQPCSLLVTVVWGALRHPWIIFPPPSQWLIISAPWDIGTYILLTDTCNCVAWDSF